MTKTLDLRLNVLRALCAIYVVLHHLLRDTSHVGILFSLGQEAVIIFFLLSGRVIRISEKQRSRKMSEFYLARLWRIYPPLLAIMGIETAMKWIGLIDNKINLSELLATLFSVQDIDSLKPGVIANPYLGNDPLWSLSYEMFFYFSYIPLRSLFRANKQISYFAISAISFSGIASYLYFPNHLSLVSAYLIAWWIGYVSVSDDNKFEYFRPFCIAIICILMCLIGYSYSQSDFTFGHSPGLLVRHFLFVLILMICMRIDRLKSKISRVLIKMKVLQQTTSLSYGLYISHFPILILWKSQSLFEYIYKIPLCLITSYFIESTKFNPIYKLERNRREIKK